MQRRVCARRVPTRSSSSMLSLNRTHVTPLPSLTYRQPLAYVIMAQCYNIIINGTVGLSLLRAGRTIIGVPIRRTMHETGLVYRPPPPPPRTIERTVQ